MSGIISATRAPTNTTRIPKFGTSRIPLPGAVQSPRIAHHPAPEVQQVAVETSRTKQVAPTFEDIGKSVRIGKSEGILRYIGEVQFASGVWCGVELLNNGAGKNDGSVHGARYFTCPQDNGLMAPVSKVYLVDIATETDCSGPYSMIFGIEDTNSVMNKTKELNATQKIIRSRTFDKIEISPEKRDVTYLKGNNTSESINNSSHEQRNADSSKVSHNALNDLNSTGTLFKANSTYNTSGLQNIRTETTFITTKKANNTYTTTTQQQQQIQQSPGMNETVILKEQHVTINSLVGMEGDNALSQSADEHHSKTDNEKTYDMLSETCVSSRLGKHNIISKRRPFVLDLPNIFQDFKSTHSSTPLGEEVVTRKYRLSPSHLDDDSNKRDSLEFEESLGILTPDQMIDTTGLTASRTPSSENIRLLPHDNESSAVGSLGLIDLSNVTMNLPLGSCSRLEQTPSPEELPLDPTPLLQDPKDKKAPNSFITSITSITSLDTGYQGDGEMSRPASRGADNSPLTRRPQPRQPPRRADPMTDSDFYTESDADNHDDNPLRGDRKAQVIDGTLYGVDAQATADLYANNRENMDSSGIFTDIERTEDISSSADNDVINEGNQMQVGLSPSDSSTQTISDDSQNNVNLLLEKTLTPKQQNVTVVVATPPQDPELASNASTIISTPGSNRSFRVEESKYKMPKRNVQSKIKVMMEPSNKENEKRPTPKKTGPGRWDAVMNKISAPDTRKGFKEVKSKVFNSLSSNVQRNNERKIVQSSATQKASPNNRRIRSRVINTTKQTGSISSSLSDLSGASRTNNNNKKAVGAAKKREGVLKVNQVLNGAKVQPKIGSNEARNNTKNNLLSNKDVKEKKKEIIKDTGRATVKGAIVTTTGNRPQLTQRAVIKQQPVPRTAEALAVLVQHLVFNLEAFKNPGLRKEADRARLEAEEARMACGLLEETLGQEKQRHSNIIQDERNKYRAEIAHLIEKHRCELMQLNAKHQDTLSLFHVEKNAMKENLVKQHECQMREVKVEFEKLQKTHDESLDILREENDAIREEIDEKNDKIKLLEHFKHESDKLRKDYESKDQKLQEANEEIARLKEEKDTLFATRGDNVDTSFQEVQSLRAVLELKQSEVAELRKLLAEASQKADQLPAVEEKNALLTAKCEDLRHQLERKNDSELSLYNENKRLNESIKEEINQKKRLHQHNEELQWRLQQNKEVFKVLEGADQQFTRSVMSSSFNERHSATKHSNNFERTLSYRERKLSTLSNTSRKSRSSLEADLDDISPPSSPKVKGVVEKSDSVSYVLEMDESPQVVASRIVRRSFRNATPPKNTPTKSPANKRPRKNCLMQSSSASNILAHKEEVVRAVRSTSVREDEQDIFEWGPSVASTPFNKHRYDTNSYCNGDYEEEDLVDLALPALPSEIGRKHGSTLPVPKHLAGEAMISESNSEDESSSSSSSGQL